MRISELVTQSNNPTSNWQIAIMSKNLKQSKNSGQNLVEMIDSAKIERSINPHIGSNFDKTI